MPRGMKTKLEVGERRKLGFGGITNGRAGR
jgi:hypothetical protein